MKAGRMMLALASVLALSAAVALCAGPDADAEEALRKRFGVVCPWGGLKDLGVGMVRTGAGATALGNWASIHKSRGSFDWTASDRELFGVCADEGLEPLPILGYTPDWLAAGVTDAASRPPSDYLQFDEFARKAVLRYKPKVRSWEIWNEPDIGFWKGTIPEYVDLLKTGFCAVRSAHGQARVVFGGLAGANIPYLEQAYGYGAGPFFDVMAVHPYQWGDVFDDAWFVSQLADVRAVMNRHGDSHKPIWLTELGWSTGDSKISQQTQARLLVQSLVTALTLERLGVEKTFWFSVKDWGGPGYGIIDTDGKPKAAWLAYRELIRRIGGMRYAGSQEVGRDARLHVFAGDGQEQVGVLWSADRQDHPVTVRTARPSVGVAGLFGERQAPFTSDEAGIRLTATPDPKYLTGRFEGLSLAHQERWPRIAAARPRQDPLAHVWMTAHPQEGTGRPYAVIGQTTELRLVLQNRLDRPAHVRGSYHLPGVSAAYSFAVTVPARARHAATLRLNVPPGSGPGLKELVVTASADGLRMASLHTPVRLSRGPVVEFLANSALDERYLTGEERGGGAPSVRFGDRWTYRIPAPGRGKMNISALVGANNAGPWSVLVSRDGQTFRKLLSGQSGKNWRHAQCEAGMGDLWLRYEGRDVQLGEVVIEAVNERGPGTSRP